MVNDDRFRRAEEEYLRQRGRLAAGRITRDQFAAALKNLMIQDAQGRYWMLHPDSGRWLMYDGQNWVETSPASSPRPLPYEERGLGQRPAPTSLPERAAPARSARLSLPLVIAIVLLCVAVVLVFGAIAFLARPADNIALATVVPTPYPLGTPPVGAATPQISGTPVKIVSAFDSKPLAPQEFATNAENLASAIADLNRAQLQFIADAKTSLAQASPGRVFGLAIPLFADPKTDKLDQDLCAIAARAMKVGHIADLLSLTMASQDNASDQAAQIARPYTTIAQMAYALVVEAQNLRDALARNALTRNNAVRTIAEYGARLWNPAITGLNATVKPSANTTNPFIPDLANPASVAPVKFVAAQQFKTQMGNKNVRTWLAMDKTATEKKIEVPPPKSAVVNPHDPALLDKLTNPNEQADGDRARQVALAQFDRADVPAPNRSSSPSAKSVAVKLQTTTIESADAIDQQLAVVGNNGTGAAVSKTKNPSGGDDVVGDILNLVGDQPPQPAGGVQVKNVPPVIKISIENVRLDKIEEFLIPGGKGHEADIEYSFTVVWQTTYDPRRFYIFCRGTDEHEFFLPGTDGSKRIKLAAVGLGPRRTTELIECEMGLLGDVRQKLVETYQVLDLIEHFKWYDYTETPTATATQTRTPTQTGTPTQAGTRTLTPTRTVTPRLTATPTATATKNSAFTMNGTFSLNWSHPEGYRALTSGLIKMTIDASTGKVTGFLSGSGNGTKPNTCVPDTPWTNKLTYEENFNGTIDLKTGALSAVGTVTGSNTSDQKTCHCKTQEVPVPYCEKGGETTPLSFKISLDGTIDLKNHTGKGRTFIATCTSGTCEGDWHAGE